jgi:hypothetical protein
MALVNNFPDTVRDDIASDLDGYNRQQNNFSRWQTLTRDEKLSLLQDTAVSYVYDGELYDFLCASLHEVFPDGYVYHAIKVEAYDGGVTYLPNQPQHTTLRTAHQSQIVLMANGYIVAISIGDELF